MKKSVKEVLKKRKIDLPFTKFQAIFNNEDACRDYLFNARWPKGFICQKCGHDKYYLIHKRYLYQCAKCKKQHSVTAGTLFQDTHLSLLKWFWAIYLVSRDKRGLSTLSLKNAIQVSYPTAWFMLQKIRQAMGKKDQSYTLNGTVVVDDAFFGGVVEGKKRGRGTEKTTVLVAVSLNKDQEPLFAKMTILENLKNKPVSEAISEMIDIGSIIRSDAHKTLTNLSGYKHEVVVASKDKEKAREMLHWVDTIISNAKAYILGTYHGLPKKYLQRYLDEFCYRLNRRFSERVIFYKLIDACLLLGPVTFAESSL